jgi:hypothetical protein
VSIGRLRSRARGARITAFTYAGAGVVVARNATAALTGAAYDTCPYDSDGFTGSIVAGSVAAEDNYSGDGKMTVPPGMGGLYLVSGLAEVGSLSRGVGTQSATALMPRITRAGSVGDTNPSSWGEFSAGPGEAQLDAATPSPGFALVMVLAAGDVVQSFVRARWNDVPVADPSVTVWAHLSLVYLGRV